MIATPRGLRAAGPLWRIATLLVALGVLAPVASLAWLALGADLSTAVGLTLEAEEINFNVSFLFGGQIKGGKMRMFMIYPAGNFIECTTDTPYLQIGEHKYGKPVLDRAVHYEVELYEALKTSLISMDSTMRSNIGVGLPIDVLVARTDTCEADLNHRIEAGEPYFHDLRSRWSAALRQAHQNIPRPPYKKEFEP